jgi:hypothetical protein
LVLGLSWSGTVVRERSSSGVLASGMGVRRFHQAWVRFGTDWERVFISVGRVGLIGDAMKDDEGVEVYGEIGL